MSSLSLHHDAPRAIAIRWAVAATAALVGLAAIARPARAQVVASQQPATTKVVCDSAPAALAPAPAVRPAKHRVVHRAPAAAVAKKPVVKKRTAPAVAAGRRHIPVRKAAGHRVAPAVAAKPAPRCHTVEVAPPQVGAVADLVNALPWAAPVTPILPMAPSAVWTDMTSDSSSRHLRPAAFAAGLLGAGLVWFASRDNGGTTTAGEQPPVVFPPPTPCTGAGCVVGGPEGPPVTTVPEPGTMVLVASGVAALAARARRKRGE